MRQSISSGHAPACKCFAAVLISRLRTSACRDKVPAALDSPERDRLAHPPDNTAENQINQQIKDRVLTKSYHKNIINDRIVEKIYHKIE